MSRAHALARSPDPKTGLTVTDARFLEALRKMQAEKIEFNYRTICKLMGWQHVNQGWQYVEKMIGLGYLERGKVLAFVDSPVFTAKGKRLAL